VLIDFDQAIDRSRSNPAKWQFPEFAVSADGTDPRILPMAVGDMDFRCPPAVIDALSEVVKQGTFGYVAGPSRGYLQAVTRWQLKRFGWVISDHWIVVTQGAVMGLKVAIDALSKPGDTLAVPTPVYGRLFSEDVTHGRTVLTVPLRLRGGTYQFDADRLESVIRLGVRVLLLCNPHNPTGSVWSRDDLMAIGEICERHGTWIVSDELHQDLVTNPLVRHTPLASLRPHIAARTITITSASKTFNLSGLQCANVIISDQRLRGLYVEALRLRSSSAINLLGLVATEAAYNDGETWVDALVEYLHANQIQFRSALCRHCPSAVTVCDADALYFAWLDARQLGMRTAALQQTIANRAGVWAERGDRFGAEGEGFLRVNLACPRTVVLEAARRAGAVLNSLAPKTRAASAR
jgi:cystathionine beta-lyase